MKQLLIALLFLSICGCGVDAVSTAATGASMKKQELEEGQRTMERMESSIEQMNLQSADRRRELADEE
jgi:hypothetical protein